MKKKSPDDLNDDLRPEYDLKQLLRGADQGRHLELRRFRDLDLDGEEKQRRLREAALEFVGKIQGDKPDRAKNARSEVRSRIARQNGR